MRRFSCALVGTRMRPGSAAGTRRLAAIWAVPGFERVGTVCVSAFLVTDEADPAAFLVDTTWGHYGLATVGVVNKAG